MTFTSVSAIVWILAAVYSYFAMTHCFRKFVEGGKLPNFYKLGVIVVSVAGGLVTATIATMMLALMHKGLNNWLESKE